MKTSNGGEVGLPWAGTGRVRLKGSTITNTIKIKKRIEVGIKKFSTKTVQYHE